MMAAEYEKDWRRYRHRRGSLQMHEWERRRGKPCPRCEENLPDDLDEWVGGVFVDEGEVRDDFVLQLEPMHVACLTRLELLRVIRDDPAEAKRLGVIDDDGEEIEQ